MAYKVDTLASEFAQIKALLLNLERNGLLTTLTVSEPPRMGAPATTWGGPPGNAPLATFVRTHFCGLGEPLYTRGISVP